MTIWIIYLTAAAAAAIWGCVCIDAPTELWQLLPAFLAALLAAHLLAILFLCFVRLCVRDRIIEKQNPFCRACCVIVGDLFCFYAGVRMHFTGLDKLPEDKNFLFVCNHRSMVDPLVVIGAMKKYNISFISKPSNMKIPVLAVIAKNAGYLAIDRENDREALKTILQAAEYLKKGICNIGIYPEGTRSKSNEMLPFRPGAFKIAQRANVPVAVACVRGSENVKRFHLFKRVDVYLDILELIPAEKAKAMKTNELSDYSRALMERNIAANA